MPVSQIRHADIAGKFNEIETLISDSKIWATIDARLGSHLATYIDVYLLGVIEESVEILVKQRAVKSSDPETINYICKDIDRTFRNPSRKTIIEVLRKFSNAYGASFSSSFPENSPEIIALQSVLDHKTNLAHKGTCQLNLTLMDAETYFNLIIPIIVKLEQILS